MGGLGRVDEVVSPQLMKDHLHRMQIEFSPPPRHSDIILHFQLLLYLVILPSSPPHLVLRI